MTGPLLVDDQPWEEAAGLNSWGTILNDASTEIPQSLDPEVATVDKMEPGEVITIDSDIEADDYREESSHA